MPPADLTATALDQVSLPSRVADPGEQIGRDELSLAARNHGMPLELLRHDLTPVGAHYLLTHYDIPEIDPATYRLEIGGLVEAPMSLDLAMLRSGPTVTVPVTLECAGNGRARFDPRPVSQPWLHEAIGTMAWTGTPLAALIAAARPLAGAVEVVFTGADHGIERGVEQDYARSLSLPEALANDALLAWSCNGVDLPPQHGFPLRLVVPGWYGMASVKWLTRIDLVDTPYDGYQQRAYRLRQTTDEPGVALTRIEPRALVLPPGFPDFMSRVRVLRPGRHQLEGRAWSGHGAVTAVGVTVDGGRTWMAADLDPPVGQWAWRRWSVPWVVDVPGRYVVSARATDSSGRAQPEGLDHVEWNRGGFANTTLHRVDVVVTDTQAGPGQ